MTLRCRCSAPVPHAFEQLGCIQCGQPCCPICAFCLESVWYCADCAGALLGLAVRRFMAEKGVQLSRIQSIGLGPIADRGQSEDKKRRVTVTLMVDQD